MSARYTVAVLSAPSCEPVTLEELKSFLRITHNHEDGVLSGYIKAARMFCENYTGKSFINRELMARFEKIESTSSVFLPRGPIASVEEVKIYGPDQIGRVLTPNDYDVDILIGKLFLKSHVNIPIVKNQTRILDVSYTAGYGADANHIPEPIRQAVLMKATQMFEGRGDVPIDMPFDMIASLLKPYKKIGVA